jgi:hypothetical protein
MDAKKFLKEKGISNNDFMDSGVADLIETLLTEYQALQLQQTGVSGRSEQLCGFFEADTKTSSATKCKCGREKWEHPKAT